MLQSEVLLIVVTYNGRLWMERCMRSVAASSLRPDVMVVDNGSTDDTLSVVRRLIPDAEIVETGINLGFGAANNIGMRRALKQGYSYVYLLNQDAYLAPDCLERLVETAKNHPEYGLLSPLQMNGDDTRLDREFMKGMPPEMTDDLVCGRPTRNVYEASWCLPAAHWLIPAEALRKTGFFSPVFPHYGEDNDWYHRLAYHGLKAGIVPAARAQHDREARPVPLAKLMHMAEMTWRYILTNPNLNGKGRRRELMKSVATFLPKSPMDAIRRLAAVGRDSRRIARARKAAMKPGAFITDSAGKEDAR